MADVASPGVDVAALDRMAQLVLELGQNLEQGDAGAEGQFTGPSHVVAVASASARTRPTVAP